jgi:TPR repeat protein
MALMQWLGLSKERADEAALAARVTALQSALNTCKEVAARWARIRREVLAASAALFLALGFMLGVYRDTIRQSIVNLGTTIGLVRTIPDAEAAETAYQKGDYETALRLARPLAEQGDDRAQSVLGRMYARGRGVPRDDVEAVRWFRSAAEQGNAAAQLNLGNMYADGNGVPQDYAEAAKWYRRAADRGDPQAQYNLGLAYAKGEGLQQDNVSAHAWFNIAASRFPGSDQINRNLAISNRDAVASKMTAEEISQAQERAREWKPK